MTQKITQEQFDHLYAVLSISPSRYKYSKWHVSRQEYPYNKYPPFVAGNFVLLSQKSIRIIYTATRHVRVFKFDDVYVGLVAYKIGIQPIRIEHIFNFGPVFLTPLMFVDHVIGSHGFWGINAHELLKIWTSIGKKIQVQSFKMPFLNYSN